MAKDKRLVKPSKGPSPDLLRKGAPHPDRTKYKRKPKYVHNTKD